MDKFLVIGLGTFGNATALGLMEQGAEVLAVDATLSLVEEIKDRVTDAARIDSTSEEALTTIGVRDFDCAIVCMGNLESSILTTLLLKKLGVPKLIARASDSSHAQILELIGATEVIEPEKNEAQQLVKQLTASHVLSYITLAEDHILAEIAATRTIIGQSIKEINFRARFKVNIIALKRLVPEITSNALNAFKHEIDDVPGPDTVIEEGDVLVVVGKAKNIEILKNEIE